MQSIPGFWDIGPHDPIPVELTWQEFVRRVGGNVVSDLVREPRSFENADFLFPEARVVAELKEIKTEFASSDAFNHGFDRLMHRLMAEDPGWKPLLFGGSGNNPKWFNREFVRLSRPSVSRILKKANRQLRETKEHFGIQSATGVILMVNDGFTGIGPDMVLALAANLLQHSFSSIDCLVYLTVNRYVELVGSDTPRLMWAPTYSDRAPDSLVAFIDDLGRQWFTFLEEKIGPFTLHAEPTPDSSVIRGSRSILLPDEKRLTLRSSAGPARGRRGR